MTIEASTVAALISERMGLHYPPDRADDLARGLEKAAADLGFANMHSLVAYLMSDQFGQREIQALASHLTIGETHFFRSPELFSMLESWLLPELIAAQQNTRRLRIWSAACAGGQEPYSLAILLAKLIPRLDTWDLTILATDINPDVFALAKAGEYTQWSFRGTPVWVINNHFTRLSDGRFLLDSAIRDMVTFRYLNLAEDLYPAQAIGMCDFDLILCRNVLMYFSPAVVKQVGDRLHRSLKENGYLIVTPSEASRDVQRTMTSMMSGGEILYKKTPIVEPEPTAKPHGRTAREVDRSHEAHSRRPHPSSHKDTRVPATPDKYRSRETAAPPALEPTWPAVDRRREGRPFSQYAKQKSGAETKARPGTRSHGQSPKVDAREAAKEARLLADKGDRKRALDCLEAALETDKLNPSLYYLKANILQEMGRYEEAERALQSILFLDGDSALARVMLGAIARGQARWTDASRHFGAALAQLTKMPPDLVLPETDGLTAGQMAETVASLMGSECVL